MKKSTLVKMMLCGAYTLPLMTSFTVPTVADVGMDMDASPLIKCKAKKAPAKKAPAKKIGTVSGVLTYPDEAGGGSDGLLIVIRPGVGATVCSTPDGPEPD